MPPQAASQTNKRPARTLELPLSGNALPLSPTGDPPVNFTLIPRGELVTMYGTFLWTDRSARECAAAWAARARRFMWDYEHLSTRTIVKDRDGEKIVVPPKLRESAGDADPVPDAQGFHLKDQKWTDAPAVRGRKWLYFSPVIVCDEETREIVDVVKSALTNDPATLSCPPLTLSEDGGFEERRVGLGGAVRHDPAAFEAVDSPDWDEMSAVKRVWEWAGTVQVDGRKVPDFARARLAFGLVKGNGSKREDYLLPHHDVVSDRLVTIRGGVAAAASALQRMQPGMGVDAEGIEGAREHLAEEAARFGEAVPWTASMGALMGGISPEGTSLDRTTPTASPEKRSGPGVAKGAAGAELDNADESEGEEMSEQARHDPQGKTATDKPKESANHSAPEELSQPALAPPTKPAPQSPPAEPHPHGHAAKVEVSAVLCTLDDGRTLWGKRRDSGKYTTPGGRLKRNERPVDCAARELKEEAGLTVSPQSLAYLGTVRCVGKAGELVDVHGYKCSLSDSVEPTSEKDPEQEVEAWEWMDEHPHGRTHVPRNALSVLSAKLPVGSNPQAQVQELSTMTSPAQKPESANAQQDELAQLRAQLAEAQRREAEVSKVITQVRELSGVDLTKPGAVGQIVTMRDASERATSAVELSEDQRKGALIEQAFTQGKISQKTRVDCKNKIRELSVADCEHMTRGPKLYDAPSQTGAPAPAAAVTAEPPESVKPREVVELSAHEKSAIAAAQRQGIQITEESVLAHKRKTGTGIPEAARVPNPGN